MTNKMKIGIILIIAFAAYLLSHVFTHVYGSVDYNESLAYKYGNTTDKLKMEIEHLFKECVDFINIPDQSKYGISGEVVIYLEDRCKPVIDHYKNLGWEVKKIGEGINDRKKDVITFAIGFLTSGACLNERFETHVLLNDFDECQRTIEYYLSNGYDLVDKYDEKVELIQRQGNETGAIKK